MNRSILIVICDFLLISLLAFSSADINNVAKNGSERTAKLTLATNQIDPKQELGNVMRLALQEEKRSQEMLVGELKETRQVAEQRQTQLTEREKQLVEERKNRESLATELNKTITVAEEERKTSQQLAGQLTETRQIAEQRQAALSEREKQLAAERKNREQLEAQLETTRQEAARASTLVAELDKRLNQTTALQQQLSQLQQSNQVIQTEKQRLSTQLQVTEAQKKAAADQAAHLEEEVKIERQEKDKLAQNIDALSKNSGQLAAEIRDNRSLTPNNVFSEFASNRVQAHFKATRTALFGVDSIRNRQTHAILVTDGKTTYGLCHVQETPMIFSDPGLDWESLEGALSREAISFPIRCISFHRFDPRVILIPISEPEAKALRCRIYRTSAEPFKFADAVVVGPKEGYYGECKFQIDLSTPGYVQMDRNSLTGLFGKFNPSTGDLVFSKTGELLGVMANSTYCMVIRDFSAAATFKFGPGTPDQHTSYTLAQFYVFLAQLPFKLQ